MEIDSYKKEAERYKPDKDELRTLFIAESPPYFEEGSEPRYFYFENLSPKDSLFKNIMEVIFPEDYQKLGAGISSKTLLLTKFAENGCFLIDAWEIPINRLPEKERNKIIRNSSNDLLRRIREISNKKTNIILIKKNIHQILFDFLTSNRINVLNPEPLPFPCCGHQKRFREQLKKLIRSAHA